MRGDDCDAGSSLPTFTATDQVFFGGGADSVTENSTSFERLSIRRGLRRYLARPGLTTRARTSQSGESVAITGTSSGRPPTAPGGVWNIHSDIVR